MYDAITMSEERMPFTNPNTILVVCTKDRHFILEEFFKYLQENCKSTPKDIVIVDASSDDRTHAVCIDQHSQGFFSISYIKSQPGLPHQRNLALDFLEDSQQVLPESVIHFLDDDIYPSSNYFSNARILLERFQDAICVGGFDQDVKDAVPPKILILSSLFKAKSGQVSRAGFTRVAYPESDSDFVEWVPGGMQNYRWSKLKFLRFDGRYRMYGEDVEMQIRAGKYGQIIVSNLLPVIHRKSLVSKDNLATAASYYSGFRYWLAQNYPDRFSRKLVLLGSFMLFFYNLTRFILSGTRRHRDLAFGELIFLRRLILRQSLRPLTSFTALGPRG